MNGYLRTAVLLAGLTALGLTLHLMAQHIANFLGRLPDDVLRTVLTYAHPSGFRLAPSVEDVAALQVKDPAKLAYVTQTTLSVDDAAVIVPSLAKAALSWRSFTGSPRPGMTSMKCTFISGIHCRSLAWQETM